MNRIYRLASIALGLAFFSLAFVQQSCTHDPFEAPVVEPDTTNDDDDDDDDDDNDTTITAADTAAIMRDTCHPDTVYYNRDVQPILDLNCAYSGCHNAASANSGVVLDNFLNVFNTADIRPSDVMNSKLHQVITSMQPGERMPPVGMLPAADIETIKTWIEQGALNLACVDTMTNDTTIDDTTVVIPSFATDVKPLMDAKCGIPGCHVTTSTFRVPFDTYVNIKGAVDNNAMEARVTNGSMPPGGNMTPEEIATIIDWIQGGAPDN